MRSSMYVAAVLGAALFVMGARAQGPAGQADDASGGAAVTATQSQPGSGTLSTNDQRFLRQTAQGAEYELAIARLAVQKATRPDIRQYAQIVINDHEQLNASLHELAQKKGVDLPTRMSRRQRNRLNHLRGLGGNAFDQAFLTDVRNINRRDAKGLQREAGSTQDPDVRSFAQQMQTADAKHDQMAQGLKG